MSSPRLTASDIGARLETLPHWSMEDGVIRRTWKTKGWKATMMAAHAVAHIAELAWHHPEIVANYATLEVRLSTHDAGGVTDKDFALAARIDALLDWRPLLDDSPLTGPNPSEKAGAYFDD